MVTINDIKDFHLDSAPQIALLETLEVSHSTWDKPIRIVTNHADGLTGAMRLGSILFISLRHYSSTKAKPQIILTKTLKSL